MTVRAALVLVTSSFPIAGDGSEAAGAFVADLVEALSEYIPVRVVAPGRQSERQQWSAQIEVFRYAAPEQPLSTLRLWHPKDATATLRVLASGARATEIAVSAGTTAHILALWALPCGEWARLTAARHSIDYSVWTLGSDIWSLGRVPIVKLLLRRVLLQARYCYSDGMQLKEDTERLGGRSAQFLPSTRNLVTSPRRSSRKRPPYRLLFLGRWHPNKGVDLLLAALRLLADQEWQSIESVELYGGGPLQQEVEMAVDALAAAGRPVRRYGYIEKAGAEAAITAADFLLIPSRIESIPVVFSDAVKLGCPVVAMPVGDFPLLMGEGSPCGVLARAVSADAYADALRTALRASPCDFENGLELMASRFDLTSCARKLLSDFGQGESGGH
ncbi:glycosyltransferase [Pseudoxanthomonas sp.]|uniref:glycosyltransferase n=1 Tax=Pseudoxanthomonas sp. TaxID=1871049 RepID=UPI0028C41A74|nr:glycosyltransferase [Pseudoxanthomonas sp.]